MSWEILLIRTIENNEEVNEIEADNIVPFKKTEIADEIKKIATTMKVEYDCEHLEWQAIVGNDEWDIEFSLEECEENETVMLHVRGNEETSEALKMLANDLGARLLECCTGDFIELDNL